jgi:hypothetical protein
MAAVVALGLGKSPRRNEMGLKAVVSTFALSSALVFGTTPARAATYPGDCNGDWTVSIGEVQRSVNMFLEEEPPACGVDASGDGQVSIGEVQKIINCFLENCPAPVLVGLDTNGDGIAEIVDADGNGTLDGKFSADCSASAPISVRLIALYEGPNPVFLASNMPQGMSLDPGGRITYQPSCADEGSTFTPSFYLEGQAHWLKAPFLITRSVHPAVAGLDTNGDGIAEIVDGNADGMLDLVVETDCNHPVSYQFHLVAADAGNPPAFSGFSMPYGMQCSPGGLLTFTPTCDSAGLTYMPSFSVDGSPRVVARFLVIQLPWLALDLDGDGIAEARDHTGDGAFGCDLAIPCGQEPTTFTLVAHDAGANPIFTASGLEGWMALANGNQIHLNPPCDGVEGITFFPQFTVEGPGGIHSPTVALPVPVYKERYDFEAKEPWYQCPQDPFPAEATVVTALDRIWHYFGPEDRRTINQGVDLPQDGTWSQVGLSLRVECPESGKCDIWDRLATLQMVLNPDDPPEQWKFFELARYITAYKTPMCEYVDVTELASMLQGHRLLQSFIDTWVGPGNGSGEGWRVTVKFIYYPGPSRAADDILGVYNFKNITVGQVDPAQSVDAQTPPVSVQIPADAWKVEAQFVTTGHSFNNTGNCAEFCQMRQDLTVNGQRISVNPWRGDCETNPVSPQPGTWLYDRNGWCPGSIVVGQRVDITDQVVRGSSNTLDFDIRLADGSVYANTDPDSWLPFEAVTLRLFVYR